jgi:predicted  nucleic acid-binding Zn-ribbon protein
LTEISKITTQNKKFQKEIEVMNDLLEEKNQENEELRKTMNNLEIEINKM